MSKQKLKLDELKKINLSGENITFDISNHPLIPNTVFIKTNHVIGNATIATIKAFIKWHNENGCNF